MLLRRFFIFGVRSVSICLQKGKDVVAGQNEITITKQVVANHFARPVHSRPILGI
jgi:hypothetical protein